MRHYLYGCTLGLCGLLAIACGSSSGDSGETTPSSSAPVAATPVDETGANDTMGSDETSSPWSDDEAASASDEPVGPATSGEPAELDEPAEPTVVAMAVLEPLGKGAAKRGSKSEEMDASAPAGDGDLDPELKPEAGDIGRVKLEQRGEVVTIVGQFHNLEPGQHGFIIRATDSCSTSRSKDHFNPTGAKHGPPSSSERHAGDLGNVAVDKDGTARFELETDSFTLIEGHASVVGKAIVLTRNKDDGKRARKAGPALACGVIAVGGQTPAPVASN